MSEAAFDGLVVFKCQHGTPLAQKCEECPPHITGERIYFDNENGGIKRVVRMWSNGTEFDVPEPIRMVVAPSLWPDE